MPRACTTVPPTQVQGISRLLEESTRSVRALQAGTRFQSVHEAAAGLMYDVDDSSMPTSAGRCVALAGAQWCFRLDFINFKLTLSVCHQHQNTPFNACVVPGQP